MTNYLFYDTSSLLLNVNHLFDNPNDKVIISSVTFQELEEIKTSTKKTEDVKQSARLLLRLLENNTDKYEVHIYQPLMNAPIQIKGFEMNNDFKILATAIDYDKRCHPDETYFVTNDLALKRIANLFFGKDSILSITEEQIDNYSGYTEITLLDSAMSHFYSYPNVNHFDLLTNEYLIIKNADGEVVDLRCWDGETHRAV